MLSFKKPTIDDKEWVDNCFKCTSSFNCEYTFGNLFVWSTAYRTEICNYNGFLICRWGKDKDISYSLPIGCGDFKEAVWAIIDDAKSLGIAPAIYGVTQGYKKLLDEYFPGKFNYDGDRAYSDYIYDVDKMAELKGKKYHSKRNHINNFKKNYPNWSFEILGKNNIEECIKLHTRWISDHIDDPDFSFEFEAVLTAFENYEKLDFIGGLIRADDEVVAYTMGEKQSDELFVTHFEKAPSDMQGAYAIINQEFSKQCLQGKFKYVNREEDLGIEGLRKAKQSYYPEILLDKYMATYNE